MKILLLEPDRALADSLDTYLNELRLKISVKKIFKEEDIFNENGADLSAYSLFILNLKNPTNTAVTHYIRSHGSIAPILLILEANPDPLMFKTVYYLGYDSVIVKDFSPEEITFSIYKLCDIWNNDTFFLSKEIFFDFHNSKFINNHQEILLGKKEALLLKFLFIKSPHTISFDEIASYVYHDEIASEERMRSLVRQLRTKIPHDFIETIKGEGYKLASFPQESL